MSKDKKHKDSNKSKDQSMFQCSNCNGVSENKKDLCKPEKVHKDDLSKKQLKRLPCKYR